MAASYEQAVAAAIASGNMDAFTRSLRRITKPDPAGIKWLRVTAMKAAVGGLKGDAAADAALVQSKLSGMIGAIHSTMLEPLPGYRDALFFPSEANKQRMVKLISLAKVSCDVCVFTITDDSIRDALLAAHRRGVAVRVISDDEQTECKGSDIFTLAEAGVPTVLDDTIMQRRGRKTVEVDRHMHNKRVAGTQTRISSAQASCSLKSFTSCWQVRCDRPSAAADGILQLDGDCSGKELREHHGHRGPIRSGVVCYGV